MVLLALICDPNCDSTQLSQKNPAEVLLTALAQDKLEARVAEALPLVAMHYAPLSATSRARLTTNPKQF
jgi:hypothetical protein